MLIEVVNCAKVTKGDDSVTIPFNTAQSLCAFSLMLYSVNAAMAS